jgi:hypothetical protein
MSKTTCLKPEVFVIRVILAVCLVLLYDPVAAHEIFLDTGLVQDNQTNTGRLQWSISYLHEIEQHTAFSLTYMNEGHQTDNHRDGIAGQFWLRTGRLYQKMVFGLGVGPYFYFNTHIHPDGSHHDLHGIAGLLSATATWYGLRPFLLQGRVNYLAAAQSFDTVSATVGIGYELDSRSSRERPSASGKEETSNELTVYAGEAVLNSARSERRTAWSIEYRRHLLPHIDWSVAWLWEGDRRPLDRYGIVTQLWLVQTFFNDRLALSAGIGPYLAYDKYRQSGGGVTKLEGDATFRASYRFLGDLAAVASWSRIFSTHDRDTDVFLGGLGYRF